ncbi:MAG: SbmA/BacA-like family transporter [Methyloceanibacter sp.]|jgi:vitamin B12/bleomycin/antimicrobial peptide transport system ATP-binding/permease protein
MDALHEISPALQQARLERRLFARFWQTASPFWFGRWAKVAWGLTVILMLVVLAQVLVQLLLNLWNRNFFDAVERRDASALWTQAKLFVPLALASIALAAISVWGRMTAQRKWRESVTRQVIEYWLAEDRFRRLDQLANGSENPEYRISEDVRIATDAPIDLVLAFLASVLTAITFLSVLWSVGGSLTFDAFGRSWTIPGYLVIGVIVYSTLFSGAMIIVGRRLTAIIERKNQAEAELRAAADRLRQDGGGTITRGNETAERRTLWLAVHTVLLRWRGLSWQLVRTTVVTHANFILAPVLALLLCTPKYLAGTMSLGELTQSAAAFVTVQSAFNWLVDNYGRLADWRSSVNRVATLLIALDAVAALAPIEEVPHSTGD